MASIMGAPNRTIHPAPLGNMSERVIDIDSRLNELLLRLERMGEQTGAIPLASPMREPQGLAVASEPLMTHASLLAASQSTLGAIESMMAQLEEHVGNTGAAYSDRANYAKGHAEKERVLR